MKTIAAVFIPLVFICQATWLTNFREAQKIATQKHQLILLNFSGSDWCGPCIRMREEILGSDVFTRFADSNLVLVNADFPRSSKNKLSAAQTKQNDTLAEKYNTDGKFPYTLLLSADGKVSKTWDGFPNESPDAFVNEIRTVCNTNK